MTSMIRRHFRAILFALLLAAFLAQVLFGWPYNSPGQ